MPAGAAAARCPPSPLLRAAGRRRCCLLGVLADWKAVGSPHCKWTDVRCKTAGLVDGLAIAGRNLSGKVFGDLLRLPTMAVLNLSYNAFKYLYEFEYKGLEMLLGAPNTHMLPRSNV
ncbi:leucine-rich repeat receptor-like protein kinase PXL2 [Hordeum vulgare]|nr:leucine-rich repeat receptor-like protein kinase PXL2 [Hordeum vulgare]